MIVNVQGRFTKYPGKETVIWKLNNGRPVNLRVETACDNKIILADCDTDELAGCIPPNPSYLTEYERLLKIIMSGDQRYIMVRAIEACPDNKHYRVYVAVQR